MSLMILILTVSSTFFLSACSGGGSDKSAKEEGAVEEELKPDDINAYTKGTPIYIAMSMVGDDVTELIEEVGTLEDAPEVVPANDGGGYEGTYKFEGFTCHTYASSAKGKNRISTVEPDKTSEVYEWSLKKTDPHDEIKVSQNRKYASKEEVAKYIYSFKKLPANFITKKEARKQGWKGGELKKKLRGLSIGGDNFGNREGILPEAQGRTYKECDIDTYKKKSRGAKRLVYSNDGVIFYTDDHYKTFEKLYG